MSAEQTNPFDDESLSFLVLVNRQDQHSLWPATLPPPAGWNVARGPDSRAACVAYLDANWTDIRPRSLRSG
ncbi:MbtH family protein [Chromobacterium phragmitis]|uniref:MbtH family protein n=1 Tax=Chromobacterium phragmitis TaxID=2202141 RepID=A0A344UCP9_9NEIS|nr:MbtH family protein [Chromobacterium phragmitis]AXE31720.1 MbtH family protein [Chromobacterium phragmitis]AXE33047.1 MbtH family protein [Chromobacterium phragmitis]